MTWLGWPVSGFKSYSEEQKRVGSEGHSTYITWLRVDVKRCWDSSSRVLSNCFTSYFPFSASHEVEGGPWSNPWYVTRTVLMHKLFWVVPASWLFLLLPPYTFHPLRPTPELPNKHAQFTHVFKETWSNLAEMGVLVVVLFLQVPDKTHLESVDIFNVAKDDF